MYCSGDLYIGIQSGGDDLCFYNGFYAGWNNVLEHRNVLSPYHSTRNILENDLFILNNLVTHYKVSEIIDQILAIQLEWTILTCLRSRHPHRTEQTFLWRLC